MRHNIPAKQTDVVINTTTNILREMSYCFCACVTVYHFVQVIILYRLSVLIIITTYIAGSTYVRTYIYTELKVMTCHRSFLTHFSM